MIQKKRGMEEYLPSNLVTEKCLCGFSSYLTGVPDSGILVYPFALASPLTQPRGSINSSRIKSLQLDMNVYPLPANTFYQYTIGVYVESLNWVTISSGVGGLRYAL